MFAPTLSLFEVVVGVGVWTWFLYAVHRQRMRREAAGLRKAVQNAEEMRDIWQEEANRRRLHDYQ